MVIDIGGGSVEITLGTATSIQLARSFKIGVIRLTERFVKTDPLAERDERKLAKSIAAEIDRHCEQITAVGFDRVIGTSGTILSIGAVAATAARGTPPTDLRNLRVSAKQIRRLRKEVVGLDLESRLAMPGLDPRRADLVVAGAVLLDTILRRLGAEELTLCDLALREGLVLDYIRTNKRQIAQIDKIPDVRRRSTIELAERCNYYSDHAQQVARLALALFDQTRAIHGLTDREREWLEYAAVMHDLGVHISYPRHHRHSYYLIKNGDLRGFHPDEIEVMALDRAVPSARHAQEVTRGVRAPVRPAPAGRAAAGVDSSRRREPRPQPRPGRLRPRAPRPWRGHAPRSSIPPTTPSWSSGRPCATPSRSRNWCGSPSASKSPRITSRRKSTPPRDPPLRPDQGPAPARSKAPAARTRTRARGEAAALRRA